MTSKIIIDLKISPDEYLAHYQGIAKEVVARDRTGRTVRFPSNILQPYVTRDGISGSFQIEFDENNRFRRIVRLG